MLTPVGEVGAHRILVRLVGDDHDLLGAFGRDLLGDLGHRQRPVMRLAAGHGDGVVEQDLVGDVDARRRGLADRHQAGMVVGAVAQILEDVIVGAERRLADPRHAFAAHVGDQRRAPFGHPDRHAVAADAGHGTAAVGDARRRVVRAARAEVRRARHLGRRRGQKLLLGFKAGQPLLAARAIRRMCFIRRPAITMATPVGVSSPSLGRMMRPVSSALPITSGRRSAGML